MYSVSWTVPFDSEADPLLLPDSDKLELSEIIETCVSFGVKATLFNEQGFNKGWVDQSGNYNLN
jgi:hypothetical protein